MELGVRKPTAAERRLVADDLGRLKKLVRGRAILEDRGASVTVIAEHSLKSSGYGTGRAARQGDGGLTSAGGGLDQIEDQSFAELREWYRGHFQARLVRAVGLGLVEPDRAAALDNDLRALIGADLSPASHAAADRAVSETAA